LRIFLDTNVVLDVLTERKPWFDDSAAVLSLLESEEVEGFVAAHTVTTLYFLIEKSLGGKKARTALLDLLKLVRAAPVDQSLLLKALSLAWDDFEDAVQGACAVEIGAEYFITRNAADFGSLSIPVHSPAEFLSLMKAGSEPTNTEFPVEAPKPKRRRST
jgi:predicted nucleic acid-binding protein